MACKYGSLNSIPQVHRKTRHEGHTSVTTAVHSYIGMVETRDLPEALGLSHLEHDIEQKQDRL